MLSITNVSLAFMRLFIYLFFAFTLFWLLLLKLAGKKEQVLCGDVAMKEPLKNCSYLMDYLYMKSVGLRRSFVTKNSCKIVNISIYR